ncbi:hypothetical protein H6G89_23675 [Oscillatoria sp. FACHB-1407]|nr:hypothetical protein [Oscillatoria sp. FACHB-1407]
MKLTINEQTAVRLLAIIALACLTALTFNLVYPGNTESSIPETQSQ